MPDPIQIRIQTNEDMILAVPHFVGHHPRESVVAVALDHGHVRVAFRIDVPAHGDTAAAAVALADGVAHAGATSAVVLLVSEHHRLDVLRAATDALRARTVEVSGPFWAQHTRPGARWSCFCDHAHCTLGGTLPDAPGQLAAEMTVRGAVVQADRAAMLALAEPGDRAALDRRARLIAAQPATGRFRPEAITAALVLHRMERPVEDQTVVDMAAVAQSSGGFSALLALVLDDVDGAAEFLLMLTRETPPPAVADIAALAGLAQCLAGNSILARAALERARQADPDTAIPTALLRMLDIGVTPPELRDWITAADGI